LPNVVVTAPSLNIFQNRLDQHWINQDVMYAWHADTSGTGNRSNILVKFIQYHFYFKFDILRCGRGSF